MTKVTARVTYEELAPAQSGVAMTYHEGAESHPTSVSFLCSNCTEVGR